MSHVNDSHTISTFTAPRGSRDLARRLGVRLGVTQMEDRCTPATITVTGTGDAVLAGDGQVTLREAIGSINTGKNINADVVAAGAYGNNDTIRFAIPGAGPHTITSNSDLTVTSQVLIDGYTQANAKANNDAAKSNADIRVVLQKGGQAATGLVFDGKSGGSIVSGLSIGGFNAGIWLKSTQVSVVGCFIGLSPAGNVISNDIGIRITGESNTVGGRMAVYMPADRNVIAGSDLFNVYIAGTGAKDNYVVNSLIGTDPTGTTAVKHGNPAVLTPYGVRIDDGASDNYVGEFVDGGRNIISGHRTYGVYIAGGFPGTNGNHVQGNFIGTDVTGTKSVSKDTQVGVGVSGTSSGNVVEYNVISGNKDGVNFTQNANSGGNSVVGNIIGLDKDANQKLDNNTTGNSGHGVYVEANDNVIGDPSQPNTIAGNNGDGIRIVRGQRNRVWSNRIGVNANGNPMPNFGNGVFLSQTSKDNIIQESKIKFNQGSGIKDESGKKNTISFNTIGGNGEHAIALSGTEGNEVRNNLIGVDEIGGPAAGNQGNGLLVTAGSVQTWIVDNVIQFSGADGVRVESSSSQTVLTGNTIADNVGRGVIVDGFATAVTVGGFEAGEPNSVTSNGAEALVFGSGAGHLFLSNHVVGTAEVWASASVAGAGEVTGAAQMSNAGNFSVVNLIEPFSFFLHGQFTQLSGASTLVSGVTTLDVTGSVYLAGGTMTLEQSTVAAWAGLTVGPGATMLAGIAGSAVLRADVVNAGAIHVGGTGSTGTLSIVGDPGRGVVGNFSQHATGTLYVELAGWDSFDQVFVSGHAALDGLLHVSSLWGYMPDAPDYFPLINYGSHSGQFAGLVLPPLAPGRHWESAYSLNGFSIWVVADPPEMPPEPPTPAPEPIPAVDA